MSRFTGLLAEIARIAGASAATRLALAAGGTEMKFSPHPKAALARIVGAEAAKAIVAELGPEKYTIPMAHLRGQRGRQAAAARMLADRASANDVAKACDIHERTARRIRQRMKSSAAMPLFPED